MIEYIYKYWDPIFVFMILCILIFCIIIILKRVTKTSVIEDGMIDSELEDDSKNIFLRIWEKIRNQF